tara:strand:+ start:291 stop:752 length:462 start_codon:yes stop_codon:yes gene_type:complete
MKFIIQLLFIFLTCHLHAQSEIETEFIERFKTFINGRDLSKIETVYQKEKSVFEKTYRVSKNLESAMLRGVEGVEIEKLNEDSPYWPKSQKVTGASFEINANPPYWLLSVNYKKLDNPIVGIGEGYSTILFQSGEKLYIAGFKEAEAKTNKSE